MTRSPTQADEAPVKIQRLEVFFVCIFFNILKQNAAFSSNGVFERINHLVSSVDAAAPVRK